MGFVAPRPRVSTATKHRCSQPRLPPNRLVRRDVEIAEFKRVIESRPSLMERADADNGGSGLVA
jgi:hypothetical protein